MTTDGSREKRELHDLVEKLPADQAPAALRYLHFLCADPILLSLLDATADIDGIKQIVPESRTAIDVPSVNFANLKVPFARLRL